MPEGHLLHRLARDQSELAGQALAVTSPQGRFAAGAAALDGGRLDAVEAYGKHLFHRFVGGGEGLRTHLGKQGKWIRLAGHRPPRPQVRVRLATPAVAWDLIAPATCEVLDDAGWKELVASLGPDPLAGGGEERAWKAAAAFPGTIGAALLDQTVVEDGRIISAPLPAAERQTVAEAEGRMVYKQATCRACGTPVETLDLAGRTAYACPVCQPR
jgi:endonuclease-8